jgi:hypothetical protein
MSTFSIEIIVVATQQQQKGDTYSGRAFQQLGRTEEYSNFTR